MRGPYQRTEPIDQLVLDGESIVLCENHYVRLGPLGTRIVKIAETPRTINDLTTGLAHAFGVPAQGSAAAATRAAVADLVAQGVSLKADCD
jgi:hypothetical protein